jgi:hypothetical protein
VTLEQLGEVETSRAFEATKRFDQLGYFHVPFDQLNGDDHTEAAFTRLVGNAERVAVVGASGCGKSSLIASVLGPLSVNLPDAIVPLRVPVAAEQDDVVIEPGSMARHIVLYATRWASAELFSDEEKALLEQTVAEATRRSISGKTRAFHIGLPIWLAQAEFARQVQSIGQDYESRGGAANSVEALRRMASLFGSAGLYPVFVFEDSDAWLSIPGLDRSQVANSFFLRVIPMLTKEIDAGLVVAVHEEYLALDGYKSASVLLSGEIRVPRLLDPRAGIETILRDRLVIAEVDSPIETIMEDVAFDWLAKFYETGRTIRDVLRVAQRSLQHALSDRIEIVGEQLVDQAITELAH